MSSNDADAARAFRELVERHSYRADERNALTNITFIDYTSQDTLTQRLQGCFRYLNRMDPGHIYTASEGFVDWIGKVLAA